MRRRLIRAFAELQMNQVGRSAWHDVQNEVVQLLLEQINPYLHQFHVYYQMNQRLDDIATEVLKLKSILKIKKYITTNKYQSSTNEPLPKELVEGIKRNANDLLECQRQKKLRHLLDSKIGFPEKCDKNEVVYSDIYGYTAHDWLNKVSDMQVEQYIIAGGQAQNKIKEEMGKMSAKNTDLTSEKAKEFVNKHPYRFNVDVENACFRTHYRYTLSDIESDFNNRIYNKSMGEYGSVPITHQAVGARAFRFFMWNQSVDKTWYNCPKENPNNRCVAPTTSHTPDLTVILHPESRQKYMRIPMLSTEITGRKEIQSNQVTYSNHINALHTLAYFGEAFVIEIVVDKAYIHHYTVIDEGYQIASQSYTFNLSGRDTTEMKKNLGIFLDAMIDTMYYTMSHSKCAYEVASHYSHVGFVDSQINDQGCRRPQCHLCWHIQDSDYDVVCVAKYKQQDIEILAQRKVDEANKERERVERLERRKRGEPEPKPYAGGEPISTLEPLRTLEKGMGQIKRFATVLNEFSHRFNEDAKAERIRLNCIAYDDDLGAKETRDETGTSILVGTRPPYDHIQTSLYLTMLNSTDSFIPEQIQQKMNVKFRGKKGKLPKYTPFRHMNVKSTEGATGGTDVPSTSNRPQLARSDTIRIEDEDMETVETDHLHPRKKQKKEDELRPGK